MFVAGMIAPGRTRGDGLARMPPPTYDSCGAESKGRQAVAALSPRRTASTSLRRSSVRAYPSSNGRSLSLAIEDTSRVKEKARRTMLVSALLGWGVNIVALLVIDEIFGSVEIGRWGSILLGAAVLGLANAFVKPVLAILTLPVILLTLGLGYFALNVLMLALAEWIASDFSIDGFWTYVGATIIVWLVNWILNALLPDAD
jgi:putative membrane protein